MSTSNASDERPFGSRAAHFAHAVAMSSTIVFLAVFLNGLLAGVSVGSTMVEHAVARTSAAFWIEYKQAKEVVYGRIMPPFMLSGIIASLIAAILGPRHLAFAIATALLAGSLVLTIVVHLPLNKAFGTWSTSEPPATWVAARGRWRFWNWVRTVMVIIAFAATLCVDR